MPDGSTCWSDAQCKTDYCRGNGGGTKKGTCGKLDVGKKCDIDANCKNDACGRKTAADGVQKKCCVSGKVGRYNGKDYCLGMPDGSTCWSDAQCASDYCKGNLSGLQRGKCTSLLPTGASCSKDYQCKSDGCGRNGGGSSRLECCPGSNFTSPSGYDYCKGTLNTGQVCASDKQCKNGNCKGNTWGDGKCN